MARIQTSEEIDLAAVRDSVLKLHQSGKIHTASTVPLESPEDLHDIYTPGVALVCRAIHDDSEMAHTYTNIPSTVAIVTNGTATLGLGDIGPVAGMPVMEGKAVLFEKLVGISGVPILVDSHDPQVVIETVAAIAPTFGAIQLEDIRAPECFVIEEELQRRLPIPVMHDDQHGTAVVVLAALINACLLARRDVRRGQVIMALSNPDPEIEPELALAAGARFAADGAAVNNVLGFPGLFKGALLARARTITPLMRIAAAEAIACSAKNGELVPCPLDPAVHRAVVMAVLYVVDIKRQISRTFGRVTEVNGRI